MFKMLSKALGGGTDSGPPVEVEGTDTSLMREGKREDRSYGGHDVRVSGGSWLDRVASWYYANPSPKYGKIASYDVEAAFSVDESSSCAVLPSEEKEGVETGAACSNSLRRLAAKSTNRYRLLNIGAAFSVNGSGKCAIPSTKLEEVEISTSGQQCAISALAHWFTPK